MKSFEKTESYSHFYAKKVLVDWLRSDCRPMTTIEGDRWVWAKNNGVFAEYCYSFDAQSVTPSSFECWDKIIPPMAEYESYPYDYCKKAIPDFSWSSCLVADAALKTYRSYGSKHDVAIAIEIVHSNPVSQRKMQIYNNLGVNVYEVSASWILAQTCRPDCISARKVCLEPSNEKDADSIVYDGENISLLWNDVVGCIEPLGAKALFWYHAKPVFYDGSICRVAIDSKRLFAMANSYVPSLKKAFESVTRAACRVSIEVMPNTLPPPVDQTYSEQNLLSQYHAQLQIAKKDDLQHQANPLMDL
jgi:hypothetical protein